MEEILFESSSWNRQSKDFTCSFRLFQESVLS